MVKHSACWVGLLAGVSLFMAKTATAQPGEFVQFERIQQALINADGGLLVDVTESYFSTREKQRGHFRRDLNIHLDELSQICQLDKRQLKKLQVGIEGVAEDLLTEWEERRNKERAVRVNLVGGGGFVGGRLIDFEAIQIGGWTTVPNTKSLSSRWRKMSQKVLTKPQQAIWQDAVQRRAEHVRATIVSMVVLEVDKKLLLSPRQRDALTELVDKFAGPAFVKASLIHTDMTPSGQMVRLVPDESLQQLLSPNQFEKLKTCWRRGQRLNLPKDIEAHFQRLELP